MEKKKMETKRHLYELLNFVNDFFIKNFSIRKNIEVHLGVNVLAFQKIFCEA